MIGKERAAAIDAEHAALMATRIWYPFGRVLQAALMDEGYGAELVLDGRLHVVILE